MTGHSSSSRHDNNNNNNNNKTPTQYDYATLYEEWLLQHHQATSGAAASSSKNDGSSSSKGYKTHTAALAARAGRLGAMQCAILDKPETETADFLTGLLERMELEFADTDSIPPLPIPEVPLPSSLPRQDSSATRRHQYAASADVDAFFQAYPECVRPDYDDDDDDDDSSSSSSSSEEEEDLQQQTRRKKRPLTKDTTPPAMSPPTEPAPSVVLQQNPYQKQQQQQQQQVVVPSRKNAQEIMGPPQAHYQDHSFSHLQQQPQQNSAFPQTKPQQLSQINPTGFSYPSQQQANHNNTQCWEDHRQSTNPFQTAREYAQASGDYVPPQQQQQQQQQPPTRSSSSSSSSNNSNNNGNPYQLHNPYQQQAQDDSTNSDPNSPMVPPLHIRDSLKRKFVPPKRGAVAAKSSGSSSGLVRKKSHDNNNNNNNNNNQRRPSSREENNNNNNNGDEDDDDLPEELKRYGKDLVEKIQNEIMDQGESITFDDIAGLEDAKTTIQEIVCWPMKRPDLFTGLRRTPNGLLLFGPPGTGKTLIGKAIAHESGATFFSISSSSLTSKWIGEGEKLVRTLFGVAAYHEPAVVFIDEIDSLLTQRKADENEASRRIKTEFLVQLDGTGTSGQGRVLVIGATNRPQELDEAARRRFVKRLYIPLPDESDRCCLLNVLLQKNQHTLSPEDVQKLATDTKGYSGADLKSLCADAAMGPIRQLGSKALDIAIEDLPPISYKHFRQSLRGMHPSVSAEDVVQYVDFDKTYGSRRASAEEDEEDDEEDMHS